MGSSRVIIFSLRVELMWCINDASVVDFPVPVAPVTSTIPWRKSANDLMTLGRFKDSKAGMSVGMCLSTAPMPESFLNKLTLNLPTPSDVYEKSKSWPALNRSF